jgi:uncharacterized radical SAM superfamily Fe-S cluster-containing enzyme
MDCELSGTHTETESLCPLCLTRIPALLELSGDEVFLAKRCPAHGEFRTIVWRGEPEFRSWKRPETETRHGVCHTETRHGCPFDCGICPSHRKNGCTTVIEVTSRCNLGCPVCFADSGDESGMDPDLDTIAKWYGKVLQTSGSEIILQLSGGEPTVRDDLPCIVEMGRAKGFSFIQLNTNGLRLAEEKDYAKVLQAAGLSSVFLQFDGTEDGIYHAIRGQALYMAKREAIERCAENGIGVVLVPTLVPGVNTHNIGAILDLALELGPTVRGVHFQPVSYFGRYPRLPENSRRLTLPDVMQAIEEQTGGRMKKEHFTPPGWENSRCSFHGNFIPLPGGGLQALSGQGAAGCCSEERAVSFTARQWSAPEPVEGVSLKNCSSGGGGAETFDGFLERVRTGMLSVSCMAFQDAWNLDLERVRDCCIHVVATDGRMVPFCLYNLTSVTGEGLYRGKPSA